MRVNLRALRAAGADTQVARYRELAQLLTDEREAEAEAGIVWVERLCRVLEVPGLGAYGMRAEHVPELIAKAASASSMRGNSIVLAASELTEIALSALAGVSSGHGDRTAIP